MKSSLRHLRRFSLTSLSALLLSGCVATLGTPAWLPNAFNDEQPVLTQLEPGKHRASLSAQGLDVDVRQEQSAALGLLALPALESMLNAELQTIKETIGFADLPGKAYILASPTMNAVVKADGNIYIPIGMVIDIDSTDEMMALLGHELAHVLLNHTDTDLLVDIQKKGASGWALVQQYASESGDNELSRRARNTLGFSLAVDRLLHPTWNRQQELAADKLAIDILVANNRDPNAMIVLLRRLDNWEAKNKQLEKDSQDRSSLLVNAAAAKYAKEGWQALMMQALTPAALAIEDEIESMAETHAGSDARLEAATEYLRQHYRRAARPSAETKQWRRVAHSAEVKRQAAAVTHAYTAFNQLLSGDLRAAENSFKRIPAREGRNQNYYRMLQAMMAEQRNKPADVASIASSARQLQYPSYRLFVMEERARQSLAPQPSAETVEALYANFDSYGRPSDYYVDLLQLAAQAGDTPLRYNILVRCYADNFGVRAACDDSPASNDQDKGSGGGVLGNLLGTLGRFK